MLDKPEIWAPVLATILAVILAWLLGHFNLWGISELAGRSRPVSLVRLKWSLRRARRIPLGAYLTTGEDNNMRRFSIKKVNALNDKGKSIPGTIELVHPDYGLDLPEGESKLHLFALSRRGRALEGAETLRLEVEPSSAGDRRTSAVQVKVLSVHTFALENLSSGDYWDDLPESLRFEVQDRLADELMERAEPVDVGLFAIARNRQQRYPYQGVAFAVSGLDELEALFPPE